MMTLSNPTRGSRRDGKIVLVTLFAIMALLIQISVIYNATNVTKAKMTAQTAADAAAHAAGLELARAMNAITAIQHLIGELQAMNVLVMSFGGIELEQGKSYELKAKRVRSFHESAKYFSKGSPVSPPRDLPSILNNSSKSGAAIGESRKQLQSVMASAYAAHAAGAIMAKTPGLQLAGMNMVRASLRVQDNVIAEWNCLDKIEKMILEKLLPIKQMSNGFIIPNMHNYSRRYVDEAPKRAADAAAAVAAEYGAKAALFPDPNGEGALKLPVEIQAVQTDAILEAYRRSRESWKLHPIKNESDYLQKFQVAHQKSQMVRASTPWVQFWRQPILAFGKSVLPLSGFAKHFHKSSDKLTLEMARFQQDDYGIQLFVLRDMDTSKHDKGQEPWTRRQGSARADELFCTIGFTLVPAPQIMSAPLFPQAQPDGVAAFRQVMIYNANPQRGQMKSNHQPVVGWDTLNWKDDVPETSYSSSTRDHYPRQPKIQINWQVKVVPTTRLCDAKDLSVPELDRILQRCDVKNSFANLH